jgi:DNA-binding XRE family transcriptional regulator
MNASAKFIRQARHKLGLTQTEFGEIIGKHRRTIVRYEQGEEIPPSVRLAIEHLLNKRKRKRSP